MGIVGSLVYISNDLYTLFKQGNVIALKSQEAGQLIVMQPKEIENKTLIYANDQEKNNSTGKFVLHSSSDNTPQECDNASEIGTVKVNPTTTTSPSNLNPAVAILVANLGLNEEATRTVINLPINLSFGFSPYGYDLEKWNSNFDLSNRDIFINLPLENKTIPEDNPGPYGLATGYSPSQNIDNLYWLSGRMLDVKGFYAVGPETFFGDSDYTDNFVAEMAKQPLIMLYGNQIPPSNLTNAIAKHRVPFIQVKNFIDESLTEAAIIESLQLLEAEARKGNMAVGIAQPYPITINAISKWHQSIKGVDVVLLSISELVERNNVK